MPAKSLCKEGARTSSYQGAELGHWNSMCEAQCQSLHLRGNLTQSEEVPAACELGFCGRDVAERGTRLDL